MKSKIYNNIIIMMRMHKPRNIIKREIMRRYLWWIRLKKNYNRNFKLKEMEESKKKRKIKNRY